MVYPWNRKSKKETTETQEETTETEEETTETEEDLDENSSLLLNILKMEGFKMNSGELFGAYKEAGGKMENFKEGLDNLLKIGKIKSDSDGNIMTLENFDRDKSQKDDVKANDDEKSDRRKEEDTKIESSRTGGENDLESIIELKNETDSWLIEQLKNKNQTEGDANLKKEVDELRDRVQKLEKIIKNLTKAFE